MKKSHSIEVQNLVKTYKKATHPSVDDVSFHVEEGSFFSLLGPNGAGKTTTISILTTTLALTSGQVTIGGYDLVTQSHEIRGIIGVIFQNPSLDLNLTAEENIRVHAMLYGLYPFMPTFSLMSQTYKKRIGELADVLGIADEIHKPIKSYSGGMKRKLEIIRSLMHDPKILFLDEPTTGLDPLSRKNLWEYLQNVRSKNNTTVFLTTHYLEEAEGSDYICVMGKGKIVSQGTPREIKSDLVDEYLLVASENNPKLEKELHAHALHFQKQDGSFKIDMGKHTAHEIIKRIQTPLSHVHVHTPTLEEAYLEIISQTDNQHI